MKEPDELNSPTHEGRTLMCANCQTKGSLTKPLYLQTKYLLVKDVYQRKNKSLIFLCPNCKYETLLK